MRANRDIPLEALEFESIVRPNDTMAWGQASAEPTPLIRTLLDARHRIGSFNAFIGATYSNILTVDAAETITFRSYCGTGGNRTLARAGMLEILPSPYSLLPRLIAERQLPIDVLLIQVAPADADGRYSFGPANDYLEAMVDAARVVVAEVNDQAPWTFGARYLTDADLDIVVRTSRPLVDVVHPPPDAPMLAAAQRAAGLIGDGSTLQLGLGTLPEAVLACLSDRRDLGLHSGNLSDGAAALIEAGVMTNARKTIDAGIAVAGVMFGTRRVFALADRNPGVQIRSASYTHALDVLARIDRFVAINGAVEVDLTGQINSEVAGSTYVGAVGGAADFLRGAHWSTGGLPIVVLTSTHGAHSRIVPTLTGPVSTSRSDAGVIVTEHGVADLRGRSLAERARRMMAIAHPDHRDALARARRNGS